MRICLMIEGQEDVTWEQWLDLATACEENGLEGLFRSDHYGSVMGRPERGSLDAWAILAALATRTSRIRLGTLVSPGTFRHPSVLAKNVVTVDHISGGRAELGIGAGWNEDEHRAYGFPMPPTATRMAILAEQLEIIHRSWTEQAFSFAGRHYQLDDLRALPKPVQQPHPTLLVGGSGGPRSVALAARFADEYNTLGAPVDELRARRQRLEAAWRDAGRDPAAVRFSVMTTCVVGQDRGELRERVGRDRGELLERVAAVQAVTGGGGEPEAVLAAPPPHWLIGTADQLVERLEVLEQVGVTRVMLQHLAHHDLDMIAVLGEVAATLA